MSKNVGAKSMLRTISLTLKKVIELNYLDFEYWNTQKDTLIYSLTLFQVRYQVLLLTLVHVHQIQMGKTSL